VVAGICRALGVTPDWLKLAEDCCKVEAELGRKPRKVSEPEPPYTGPMEVLWLNNGVPYNPNRPRDSS
jgi:hypothetical protein